MKKQMVVAACVLLASLLAVAGAAAKKTPGNLAGYRDHNFIETPTEPSIPPEIGQSMFQAAAATTTVLGWWQFDNGVLPDPQGWAAHDMTEQLATYFHVAGSAGGCDPITPIAGTKSMWCGKWPTTADPWCGWMSLPGYGNNWDQSLEAQNVSTLSYSIAWDTEAGYDYAYLEWWDPEISWWTEDTTVNGGQGSYSGIGSRSESVTSPYGPTKVRIHFVSDIASSDEDGDAPTLEGAVKIDNLSINGGAAEDWEDEACGVIQSNDGVWVATHAEGFGLYAQLVHGASIVQQDPCFKQNSYLWGFFDNPAVTNYACGGWPLQGAMPFGGPPWPYGYGVNGLYMNNEIWSPWVPVSGSGSSFQLQFLTYRDLPLDNLQVYTCSVRTRDVSTGGCPTAWRTNNTVYYGDAKDWFRERIELGPYMASTMTDVQIALGAVDMCGVWCGWMGTGACHSHAPLFDQVRLVRVGVVGPQWAVRDIDLWQDNFPEEGGVGPTDYARCDMALNLLPSTNPNILPGDSLKATVFDPVGLADDNTGGRPGKAVYVFVKVTDRYGTPITGKNGLAIQSPDDRAYAADPLAGNFRWPFVPGLAPAGWDAYRMDYAYTPGGGRVTNAFCCDLMDLGSGATGPHYNHANENAAANTGIFAPGDVIRYFFGAKNANNEWSYWHRTFGNVLPPYYIPTIQGQGPGRRTSNVNDALMTAGEWSVLPDAGRNVGELGDILLVDDADDRVDELGEPVEIFFDWAFSYMGVTNRVDRFDVLGPSSAVGNSLASRVKNIQNQLIGNPTEMYQQVLWNCSDLSTGLMGDGGTPSGGFSSEKSDDFGLCYTFLDQHPDNPGWLYMGDDVAEDWVHLTGARALDVKSVYINHVLLTQDQNAITGILSPKVWPVALSPWVGEKFYAFGGCPATNDFDAINATGTKAKVAYLYNNQANAPAAVYQATPNAAGTTARFFLAGFGYDFIRDDDAVPPMDRMNPLKYTLQWFQNTFPAVIGIGPVDFTNNLEDNYPNPFNPTTTIRYSIASAGHVSLKIYNAAGQLVRTLVNEEQAPRAEGFAVPWDGTSNKGESVASGVYFYKLTAKNFEQTKKMVLLK